MVHTFINQSFNIFRVPVISVKLMDMVYYIAPFKKEFFASLPPLKIAIFWLNIYPSIFNFSSCPSDYNCDYVFIPYSFHTMQELMDILLSVKSLNSHIEKGEATRPLHFKLYINH